MTKSVFAGDADEALILAVRAGDRGAYATLWERHFKAGLVAARSFANLGEPDDLVAEAFATILRTIQNGAGPVGAFRPYLYTTIRNLAVKNIRRLSTLSDVDVETLDIADPEVKSQDDVLDGEITAAAFSSLPERWQSVLWYVEVEQMSAAEAGVLLGLKPNAATALVFRARHGLRSAWLQSHVAVAPAGEQHRFALDNMGDFARDELSARDLRKVNSHLAGCVSCSNVAREIRGVAGRLGVVLLPLILGGVAARAFVRNQPVSVTAAPHGFLRIPKSIFEVGGVSVTGPALVAAAIAVVAVGSAITVIAVSSTIGLPAPAVLMPATSAVAVPAPPSSTSAPQPAVSAAPSEEPAEPPEEPVDPRVVAPSRDTSAPKAPVVTSTVSNLAVIAPTLEGTAEPFSLISVATPAGSMLALVEADARGRWSSGPLTGLSPTATTLEVTQTDAAGNVSPKAVVGQLAFAPTFDSPTAGAHYLVGTVALQLRGWPGTQVVLSFSGNPTSFQFTFDPKGMIAWTIYGDATAAVPAGSYSVTAQYGSCAGLDCAAGPRSVGSTVAGFTVG